MASAAKTQRWPGRGVFTCALRRVLTKQSATLTAREERMAKDRRLEKEYPDCDGEGSGAREDKT